MPRNNKDTPASINDIIEDPNVVFIKTKSPRPNNIVRILCGGQWVDIATTTDAPSQRPPFKRRNRKVS